jgi:hypothetical protein
MVQHNFVRGDGRGWHSRSCAPLDSTRRAPICSRVCPRRIAWRRIGHVSRVTEMVGADAGRGAHVVGSANDNLHHAGGRTLPQRQIRPVRSLVIIAVCCTPSLLW